MFQKCELHTLVTLFEQKSLDERESNNKSFVSNEKSIQSAGRSKIAPKSLDVKHFSKKLYSESQMTPVSTAALSKFATFSNENIPVFGKNYVNNYR